MSKPVEITDSNYTEIFATDKPVLVDFWAEWCGPCKMIGPIIEQMASEYEGKAVIGKVDVDANPEIAVKYSVRSIPTLIFFKDGKEVDKQIGAASKALLTQKLDQLL